MTYQKFSLSAILTLLFFAWMIWVGYKSSNKNNLDQENFLIGNRTIQAWLVAIGICMSWVDAFQFGFTTQLAYEKGWFVLCFPLGVAAAFLLLYIFAGRIREQAASTGVYMMGNFFAKEFSPRSAAIIGIINIIYFFIWLIIQVFIGGHVLAELTGFSYITIVVIMSLVTLCYLEFGGFLASIKTDLIQFILFCIFILVIIWYWAPSSGTWIIEAPDIKASSSGEMLTLFFISLSSTFAAPDVWQRIYSAASAKQARASCLILSLLMALVLIFFICIGMILKANNLEAASSDIILRIFTELTPEWLFPFTLLAFLSAIMSTIATTLFGTAMAIASDIGLELNLIDNKNLALACRWLMPIILIAAILFSTLKIDLISLGFTCLSVTQVPLPLLFLMLIGKKVPEAAAFWSLTLSLIVFLIGAYYNIYTGNFGLLPLFFAICSLVGVKVLVRK